MLVCCLFFYDEMVESVSESTLHLDVVAWLHTRITTDLEKEYLADIDLRDGNSTDKECSILESTSSTTGSSVESSLFLTATLQYNLDGADSMVALNILPVLTAKYSQSVQPDSTCILTPPRNGRMIENDGLESMCALIRLLAICERSMSNGSLNDINAVLGCPLYLPSEVQIQNFHSLSPVQKELICKSFCYAIDWFRELVNAFSSQDSVEMKSKVCQRLQQLKALEMQLDECLNSHTTFVHPSVSHLGSQMNKEVESTKGKQKASTPKEAKNKPPKKSKK
eukprot:GILJ01033177.1.p1 GENE.GILJ01033177.1~~GILJ01033177.1.p1  ORF type:complete len:281 (-),score=48.31 GILJ01033177.1:15-857(-)